MEKKDHRPTMSRSIYQMNYTHTRSVFQSRHAQPHKYSLPTCCSCIL